MAARKHETAAGARAAQGRSSRSLRARLARIELVALDVDGVLTDGRVVYGPGGRATELQFFHVQDGIAIEWLREHGIEVAWITGRGSAATKQRARELGVRELHVGVKDKRARLVEIQRRKRIAPEATLAMGDDFPDLQLIAVTGVFCAPQNGVPEVRARADLVTRASGGAGAVRELVRELLIARGAWTALVARSLR